MTAAGYAGEETGAVMKRKIGEKPASRGGQALLLAAVQHLQAGRLTQARAAYRRLLDAQPSHIVALHHLGVVEHQLGERGEAIQLLRLCLAAKPYYAQVHCDLGVMLM